MKMTDLRILFAVFLVLLNTELHDAASVIETPQNVYGMEGTSINLTCVVTGEVSADPFEWREYITQPTGGVRIFSDPETVPLDTTMYEIYGRYTLNIKSLNWQDNGGEYGCKVFTEPSPHTAHVFVFQQHSMSAMRMQAGEKTQLVCESRFGAMDNLLDDPDITVPTIALDIRGNQLPNVVTQLIPKTQSDPWILHAVANYTADKYHDGEDFGCTVTIQEPYAQIRDTIKLDIMFQVEEPSFTPFNAMYYVDEYINCTAMGNPDPSYEWRSIDSPMGPGVSIPGSQLAITADMLGGTNQWECSATNSLNGMPYTASKTITFEVDYNPDQPNPDQPGPVTGGGVEGWKIAVGICVPLAIIAIAVGIFFGLKYMKKKRASAYGASDAPPEPEKTGNVNPGAALPSEGDLSNGKVRDVDAARTPVSMQPNPLPQNNPANRSKDSPGYADLGVKQITGSYPGMNVSMSSSMDSFDDGEVVNTNPNPAAAAGKPPAVRQPPAAQQPPAGRQPPAAQQPPAGRQPPVAHQPLAGRQPPVAHQPPRYANASFEPGPPPAAVRMEDLKPNHPDTFV